MTDPKNTESPANPSTICTERAPFLVGVTGYMDLVDTEIDSLSERLRRLFRFLRGGGKRQPLDQLIDDLVPDKNDVARRKAYQAALSHWTGLGPETPIIVMCNLAPGVDTLVARLVREPEFANDKFHLRIPLPFPPHIYAGASTFVRVKDGNPVDGNRERQQDFLRVLAEMGAIDKALVEEADGTVTLPTALVDALKNVDPVKFFAVRLQEDKDRNAAAQEQQWLVDRDDSDRRNLRYFAAGEFLAVTTHLLVAVWNGERDGSRSGTSKVVDARLAGPTPGLLATTTDVPLPHGGPVWHLLASRRESSPPRIDQCAGTRDVVLPLPPLRILHSFLAAERDCPQSAIVAPGQADSLQLQQERLRLFARIGESLRTFNTVPVPLEKKRDEEFEKKLKRLPGDDSLAGALLAHNPQLAERLRAVSDISCRASELTSHFQKHVNRTLAWLFWLTFLAAVALHLFTHWHPRSHKPHPVTTAEVAEVAEAAEAAEHPEPQSENGGHEEHLNAVQHVAGWSALALTAFAILFFACQRCRKLEANDYDARAIAEGLRVQFFWNLAGLGESVSANYMSRHRSELDWIRAVIRSTSVPYGIWARWFAGLPAELQLRALRAVRKNWIQHQPSYFRRSSHRDHHRLHIWHKLGAMLALAGVLVCLKLAGSEAWPAVAHFIGQACHGGTATVLLGVKRPNASKTYCRGCSGDTC